MTAVYILIPSGSAPWKKKGIGVELRKAVVGVLNAKVSITRQQTSVVFASIMPHDEPHLEVHIYFDAENSAVDLEQIRSWVDDAIKSAEGVPSGIEVLVRIAKIGPLAEGKVITGRAVSSNRVQAPVKG